MCKAMSTHQVSTLMFAGYTVSEGLWRVCPKQKSEDISSNIRTVENVPLTLGEASADTA